MVNRIRLLTLTLFLLTMGLAHASVTSKVNRTEVYSDESLLLTVTVSPIGELNQADINALRSLFVVEQSYKQQSTQNINGRKTSKIEYQFQIRPKQTGVLGIPNFRVGSDQSKPVFVTVLNASQRKDSLPEDAVLLTATLNKTDPYVDEPIELTIELAYKIALKGAIDAFEFDKFEATVVGDHQSTKTINGQLYNTFTRVIHLVSKNPGIYSIPPPTFTGEYPNNQLGRYVRISRAADAPAINVQPIPDSFPKNAYWLPLNNLVLSDNLDTQKSIEQGEHLDWQIAMDIEGLSPNRLPDPIELIEDKLAEQVRIYRNAPQFSDTIRLDSAALTFNVAGDFAIPEIRIPWWNTQTQTLQWAELPQRTLSVSRSTQLLVAPSDNPIPTQTAAVNDNHVSNQQLNYWPYITAVCIFGWLMTIIYFVSGKRNEGLTPDQAPKSKNVEQWHHAAIQVKNENYKELYEMVLKRLKSCNVSSDDLEHLLDSEACNAFKTLERALYTDDQSDINKEELTQFIKALNTALNKKSTASPGSTLNLYPAG